MEGNRPEIAVIGAGALGTALAMRLHACGYPVCAVVSRTYTRARSLADAVGAVVASDRLQDLPGQAGVVFCCVPDDAIPDVAGALAQLVRDWKGVVVAHTSGALSAGVLRPVADRGAAVLSFHPVQTFTPETPPTAFAGIFVGLEGDAEAIRVGASMAEGIGARSVVIPPDAKPLYHLAASVASNFAVTLASMALEVLGSIGVDRRDAADLLAPLVSTTLHKLAANAPESVLTGPIVRGDVETVQSHVAALQQHLPHLAPVYAALAVETVRLACRSGRLSQEQASRLLEQIEGKSRPSRHSSAPEVDV